MGSSSLVPGRGYLYVKISRGRYESGLRIAVRVGVPILTTIFEQLQRSVPLVSSPDFQLDRSHHFASIKRAFLELTACPSILSIISIRINLQQAP